MASLQLRDDLDSKFPIQAVAEGSTKMYSFLNTIDAFIKSDGEENFISVRDKICDAFEALNEILEIRFDTIRSYTLHWTELLEKNKRALQQIVYTLKLLEVEKTLWKRLLPCLVFARMTKKTLGGAERWKAPRVRKRKKEEQKTRKLAGLSYLISVKKMLRRAIDEKDNEALDQIMGEMQRNMPFGSTAHLTSGVQEFLKHDKAEKELRKRQKKVRHCYYAKVGRGALPKLADEHFCTMNRRFILPYRNPATNQDLVLDKQLERLHKTEFLDGNESSSSSDSEFEL